MTEQQAIPLGAVEADALSIADLRRELGLTLAEMGERVGLSKSQMHDAEAKNRASLGVALRIEELSGGRIDAAAINEDVRLARHGLPDTAETEGSSPGKGGEISPESGGGSAAPVPGSATAGVAA